MRRERLTIILATVLLSLSSAPVARAEGSARLTTIAPVHKGRGALTPTAGAPAKAARRGASALKGTALRDQARRGSAVSRGGWSAATLPRGQRPASPEARSSGARIDPTRLGPSAAVKRAVPLTPLTSVARGFGARGTPAAAGPVALNPARASAPMGRMTPNAALGGRATYDARVLVRR